MESRVDKEELLFTFEKLEVYGLSTALAKHVYALTKGFPPEEQYGLTSQLRRAAVSIASNVAEGSARFGAKEKAHFFGMAYGSLMEVVCQTDIAYQLGFITEGAEAEFRLEAAALAKRLSALRRSQVGR